MLMACAAYTFPNAMRKIVGDAIQRDLPPTVARDPHFTPSYNPFEQRVCFCPDGDFYAALRSGKASVETGVIEEVTPNSIKLVSGKERTSSTVFWCGQNPWLTLRSAP